MTVIGRTDQLLLFFVPARSVALALKLRVLALFGQERRASTAEIIRTRTLAT